MENDILLIILYTRHYNIPKLDFRSDFRNGQVNYLEIQVSNFELA